MAQQDHSTESDAQSGGIPTESGMVESLADSVASVIADRTREHRKERGLTVGELAERAGLSKGMVSKIETAQTSPSLTTLAKLAAALSIPVTAFFRGLEEERDALHIKAGKGLDVVRDSTREGHRLQLLGNVRGSHRRMEPVLITLLQRSQVFPLFQHAGTEFLYMISGTMEYGYGSHRYLLEPGDSLQFDGTVVHGPTELHTLPIQFLSIKAYGNAER